MGKKDARIDQYIANAAPFARPILKQLRAAVHEGCPECQETLKWGMPSFVYKGILAGMAAFKQHAAFGFWKHKLVVGGNRPAGAMGSFGRLTSIRDLPARSRLVAMVKKAKKLNDDGVKAPRVAHRKKRPELPVPPYLKKALAKNPKARVAFASFSPSHRREYIEWVTEAKTEETRDCRVETAIAWMTKGKSRNWKYQRR